jgi:hypothetical protein
MDDRERRKIVKLNLEYVEILLPPIEQNRPVPANPGV